MKDKARIIENVKTLKDFIGNRQLNVMTSLLRGEEGEHFENKLEEYATRVTEMPATYGTEGTETPEKIVHLHYFYNNMDWYIVEKDMGDESADTTQYQAFGLADIGFGLSGLGYISIDEITGLGAELDLYWTPKTVKEVHELRGE